MSKLQKPKSTVFIDYIPAELKENKDWRIVFYVKNPYTGKLEPRRPRVRKIKSITERRKLAKRMIVDINTRLSNGWNPIFEEKKSKGFSLYKDACAIYLKHLEKEVKEDQLSKDTFRTYKSRIDCIQKYLDKQNQSEIMCYQVNADFSEEFLDYVRYELNNSARTRDNYLTFMFTLFEWMKRKKYLVNNPCEGISKIHKKKNDKIVISKHDRELIFNYYKNTNVNFFVFCMCCYYCLVRRTELSKIKVGDVNLKNGTLWISSIDSKNNKSAHVTIPPSLALLLANHLQFSKNEDYLFSDNNYAPGPVQFKPNKATSNWSRMRKKIGISPKIKWYYLKDSGIVDLIEAGVPLNSVRDQARHHSISQTNDYIPKNMKNADSYIKDSGVKFS